MALTAPKLDDRQFQDIVDEAKKRIPHYSQEWTDHNVSDPGITLIELFAWMTEMILYRMNQVPDMHYVKFLEMMGISLHGPEPARTPITFWLSAPQTTAVLIPVGTEVSNTQTETERPIVFSTDRDFRVEVPILAAVLARLSSDGDAQKAFRSQNMRRLESGFEGFEVFSRTPQVDDALYLGFENDISKHILGLEMDFDPAGGTGIDPDQPPYVWEASTGRSDSRWSAVQVEYDTTKGMNTTGKVRLFLPDMGRSKASNHDLYWVRARVKDISPAEAKDGMRPYRLAPRLRRISTAAWGGTTPATHAQRIRNEFVGHSEGMPGERFQLKHTPILTRSPKETLSIQVDGEPPQTWHEVPDFSFAGPNDRCFTLDSVTGELRLGPAVRQPDGTIKLYGAIPPRSSNLIFESYRYGGGQEGNVQAGVINTLKSAIPYISRVVNREPAWGGLDAESLEAAMMRAPAMLRSRERAVTETDYEFLARQAQPAAIGRVKCLQPRPSDAGRIPPGQVFVLIVPRLPHPEGYLTSEQLELSPELASTLSEHLDQRRLLTTRLSIRNPAYLWVSVNVTLRAAPGVVPAQVEAEILKRLYRFLNPLTGGPDGKGWPFGRDLFTSDVYQCLSGIPNVQFVRLVEMYSARPNGEAVGEPVESLEVIAHGVIASGRHSVKFI
jgi:predicted phage baseplate assembly protein